MKIYPTLILLLAAATCVAEESPVILDNDAGLEFVLEKDDFRHDFRKPGGEFLAAPHPESGLLAGKPGALSKAKSTEYTPASTHPKIVPRLREKIAAWHPIAID